MLWTQAADPPALGEDELHLWRFALGRGDPQTDRSLLSPAELGKADRYSTESSRAAYQSGRANLRWILGRYLDTAPENLSFVTGRYGKPGLDAQIHRHPPEFSLSHSHGVGLLAVARRVRVGVDIEWHDPARDIGLLANSTFSAKEHSAWSRLVERARFESFFQIWVCKEAFIKATGRGIGYGLKRFDVSVGTGTPSIEFQGNDEEWGLRTIDVGPGFSAAVVAAQQSFEIKTFETSCSESGNDLLKMDEHNHEHARERLRNG